MADPRGHAFNRSNAFRHPPRPKTFDHPTKHGWLEIGISEVDGCTIFDLGGVAQMKADLSNPGQWIGNVLVNGKWQGLEVEAGVTLAEITERVRQMADNHTNLEIPFNGEPMYGNDELGLEARG